MQSTCTAMMKTTTQWGNEHDKNNKSSDLVEPKNLSSTHSAKVLHLGSTRFGAPMHGRQVPKPMGKFPFVIFACPGSYSKPGLQLLQAWLGVSSMEQVGIWFCETWGPKLPRNAVRFLPRFVHDFVGVRWSRTYWLKQVGGGIHKSTKHDVVATHAPTNNMLNV